jgi:hypothetical protein
LFCIELKRVLTVEKQILADSKSFTLSRKERNFKIETVFDWYEMNIEDILIINKVNLNELYEKWKKNICDKRPCQQQHKEKEKSVENESNIEELKELENSYTSLIQFSEKVSKSHTSSSCDCNSELNLDSILHRQPINEIELHEETCSRLNEELSPLQDNHHDETILLNNDRSTTETLLSDKNSRRSLFKLDKATSTHSLSPIIGKQSNIFDNFFTDLFIFEKNPSRNHNLGKHEHWISNAMASYIHPFNDYPHQQCSIEKKT